MLKHELHLNGFFHYSSLVIAKMKNLALMQQTSVELAQPVGMPCMYRAVKQLMPRSPLGCPKPSTVRQFL